MPQTAVAPYAQAAVVVNQDGSIERSHGVEQVYKTSLGTYTIIFEDGISENSVPIASLISKNGNPSGTALVILNRTKKGAPLNLQIDIVRGELYVDWSFSLIVP